MTLSKPCGLLSLLLLVLTASPPPVRAETIKFRSEMSPKKWSATISGQLTTPKGAGPFPVVVLLHPCAGITPVVQKSLNAHASVLRGNKFAVLILDSFSARSLNGGKACAQPLGRLAAEVVTDDAFNAMAALGRIGKIDADNIFVSGQSLGGHAAIMAAIRNDTRGDTAFRAVAAWYPSCRNIGVGTTLRSPLIVFGAGKDDWTPMHGCRAAKTSGLVKGAEYEMVAYPNALHGFDQPMKTRRYKGHTLGYDAAAAADARQKMVEFFKRHMKAK